MLVLEVRAVNTMVTNNLHTKVNDQEQTGPSTFEEVSFRVVRDENSNIQVGHLLSDVWAADFTVQINDPKKMTYFKPGQKFELKLIG